jgi:hypothetical protein
MTPRVRAIAGWLAWLLVTALPAGLAAQTFNSGSTGAQGPFPPTGTGAPPAGTTQYSLSLADGRLWYAPSWMPVELPNTPEGGFRDGVLNFTTFNVPTGISLYFYKNSTNTPVTILATGSVTISGTIDVSGAVAPTWGRPGTGGPGGFDGGAGGDGLTVALGGVGLGPGGGGPGSGTNGPGGGGGHGSSGATGYYSCGSFCTNGSGGATYGSAMLRPIVGGSGGGGGAGVVGSAVGGGGGGGGGAILIASSSSITVGTGAVIRANGGAGGPGTAASYSGGGGGSGGAIRLVAPTISGNGTLSAPGAYGTGSGGNGGSGRIRLEASTFSYAGSSSPLAVTSLPQPIYPSTGQPSLAITSIGGVVTPASPRGSVLGTPDIVLPAGTPNPVSVGISATNIPLGTAVQLTAAPQTGARTAATCTLLDGSQAASSCTASLNISLTLTSVLTASATFPLVASAEGPLYADGEEVRWVRVASVLGGGSSITYLTASGREVPALAVVR